MPGLGAHGRVAGIAGHGSVARSRGWLIGQLSVEAPGHIPGTQPPISDAAVNLQGRLI